jgi:Ice-binding-like
MISSLRLFAAIAGLSLLQTGSASASHLFLETTDPRLEELDSESDTLRSALADESTPDGQFASNEVQADNFSFHFASSNSLSRIDLSRGESMNIGGAPGETVRLSLRDFVLGGHSRITLEGTATTSFIINVRKQFSLTGMSRVVLSGGVQWDNVIFQIHRRGTAVRLTRGATLWGVIVAKRRSVLLNDESTVYGRVYARRLGIRDSAQVIEPPIVSP